MCLSLRALPGMPPLSLSALGGASQVRRFIGGAENANGKWLGTKNIRNNNNLILQGAYCCITMVQFAKGSSRR